MQIHLVFANHKLLSPPSRFEGKEQVFEAKVKDPSHVYQAGSNIVVVRVAQGSAAITVDGKRLFKAHALH